MSAKARIDHLAGLTSKVLPSNKVARPLPWPSSVEIGLVDPVDPDDVWDDDGPQEWKRAAGVVCQLPLGVHGGKADRAEERPKTRRRGDCAVQSPATQWAFCRPRRNAKDASSAVPVAGRLRTAENVFHSFDAFHTVRARSRLRPFPLVTLSAAARNSHKEEEDDDADGHEKRPDGDGSGLPATVGWDVERRKPSDQYQLCYFQ